MTTRLDRPAPEAAGAAGVPTPEALDAVLTGPDGSGALGAEADSAERFPAELHARLADFGLSAHYVPPEHGGSLDDHERLLRLWHVVARHDVSAVVAHGKTYLGAAPVWIAGDADQTTSMAAAVLSGRAVAWGLSEPDHGADLRHGSVTAAREGDGYRVDGVKWPINNATRGDFMTLLARTGPAGSPRGHSLFLVDKAALAPGSARPRPKVATHGVRGADISGLEFAGARLPETARIGAEGTGIETVLLALQLTRTMCAALSSGAGEHALRITARFAATRLVQRRPLSARPRPAAILARCAALLAGVEAASLVAARSAHALTGEMSVTSAIVKPLAPAVTDAVISDLAELLGVRSYLVDHHEHGAFQKLSRDHQVVAVFDGSTPVNRAALAQQFPRLVRGRAGAVADTSGLAEAVVLGTGPRPLDRSALTLVSRRGCTVVQALPRPVGDGGPPGLAEHVLALHDLIDQVTGLMAEIPPAALPAMPAYELAAAYELCYAGAACVHLWTACAEQHADEPLWQDGLWVRAALRALTHRMTRILRIAPPVPAPGDDELDAALTTRVAEAALHGAPVTPFGIGEAHGR